MLVTLKEAKDHLEMDHDLDDQLITLYIKGASEGVINYLDGASLYQLKEDGSPVVDGNDNPVVKDIVKVATLILIGEFYKNREADQAGEITGGFGYGYLPLAVTRLLYPLRYPSMA